MSDNNTRLPEPQRSLPTAGPDLVHVAAPSDRDHLAKLASMGTTPLAKGKTEHYPTPGMSINDLKSHQELPQPKFNKLLSGNVAEWPEVPHTPNSISPKGKNDHQSNSLEIPGQHSNDNAYWGDGNSIGDGSTFNNIIRDATHSYLEPNENAPHPHQLVLYSNQSPQYQQMHHTQVNGAHQQHAIHQNQDLRYHSNEMNWSHHQYTPDAYTHSEAMKPGLYQNDSYLNETRGSAGIMKPSKKKNISLSKSKKLVLKKDHSKAAIRRWTESDDDKVAFLREYGNLKWHEVTEFINGRHTPQAVQMRYLRSLKRRNDTLTPGERTKLKKLVEEDYESRFKRISTQMGPSFTQVRIQKIFMEEAGYGDLLKAEKVWTKEEISKFVDEAAGDFDNFEVPYRADKLPSKADEHMERVLKIPYIDLVRLYVGGLPMHSQPSHF